MADIFLSFADEDGSKARALANLLEWHGWSVWWDKLVVPPGKSHDDVIEEALGAARCVIVLWSKSSVASEGVRHEAEEGLNRRILIPVLLEDVYIPLSFRRVRAFDFRGWDVSVDDRTVRKFLKAITNILGPVPVAAPIRREPRVLQEGGPTLEPEMIVLNRELQEPPRGKPEMPKSLTDRVHFSVTAPPEVAPGDAFVLDIWAHLERQRAEVLERARQHVGGGSIFLQEKGPVRITRGTVLTVRVQVEGLVIPEPEDTILWEGEIGSAGFPVQVPEDEKPGPRAGTARFYVDAFEVAKLHFSLSVGRAVAEPENLPAQVNRYRSAFASYASEDNDEVLNILQGIKMGMPDLDVFYAEASLRAGEHWPERLKQEILARDVFYLFWSRAASVSPWVDMEWRFAFEKRGIDVIKPVPLAPPHVVPPPPELAATLHFNDWVLAHKRNASAVHSRSSWTG